MEYNIQNHSRFLPSNVAFSNSYYNSLGKFIEKKNRMFLSRPSLEKVLEYRKSVESDILDMIEGCDDNILSLIELGINHEQQHQELLVMDIKENMFRSPYFPSFCRKIPQNMDATPMKWEKYEEGIVEIGHNGLYFSMNSLKMKRSKNQVVWARCHFGGLVSSVD